eukprot:CAMPEP_0116888420 /NCGR_PEP_ID=MMETSP0463-20121206/23420_1 /TAXON_ID=181622 /ORGANISM="Strombidinopsis sp, Strain SopsisLIS2011" /LENGTH=52 /DNA_ID=CAMNT_0004553123 /DNA_START=64 /DNA_END=222 /DNA_ORIENTATION=-
MIDEAQIPNPNASLYTSESKSQITFTPEIPDPSDNPEDESITPDETDLDGSD